MCLSALLVYLPLSWNEPTPLTAENIAAVVAQMTLDEKIDVVVGAGNEKFVGYGSTKRIVPGACGLTTPIPRFGITPTVLTDGPAGLRIDTLREGSSRRYYHTCFPIGTALASTWNASLIEEVGKAIGNEAHEYGLDLIFAPGMNIHRDPLGGRNFEYYSEDPLLSGKMAAAFVRGIQSNGVGATLKHFAVNNQETNRKDVDVSVAQRPLRELYLRNFEIAVREGKPWAVMSAYNMINGRQCMENRDLLTTILHDEWGSDAFVVSDWADAGWRDSAKEIWAGNDLLAPGTVQQRNEVRAAVEAGTLSMAALDSCVTRVLRYVVRTPRFNHYKYSDAPDLVSHAEMSRQAAEEAIILLENKNNTLPMAASVKRVGMFGVSSYNFISVGTGSGNVKTPHTVNLQEGFAHIGVAVNTSLANLYADSIRKAISRRVYDPLGYDAIAELEITDEAIKASAMRDDMALLTIGRSCGEGADRLLSTEYHLSTIEQQLIDRVCAAFHAQGKRVVVVLNVSGVVEVDSWRTKPDAVVLSWLLGQEGGDAVCRVLAGTVSPSGRLPMTFPVKYEDCNTHDNFPYDFHGPKAIGNYTKIPRNPAIKNVHYVDYGEGVYVGYRYFDTFDRNVSYPFGYGQSYTQFGYNAIGLTRLEDGKYEVSVTVVNTGKAAGKETVQVYAPVKGIKRQLIAFGKTRTIAPGERDTVKMQFTDRDLAYFDEGQMAWLLEAGKRKIEIGANSRDIWITTTLNIAKEKVLEKVKVSL